ncbi:hypothetical protein [Pseudomonas urmiensis]|uniref:hypothetical protein n=1 Tax=Pseudomonas urmiensis TaxID=2745493 RepID=UPI0034D65149
MALWNFTHRSKALITTQTTPMTIAEKPFETTKDIFVDNETFTIRKNPKNSKAILSAALIAYDSDTLQNTQAKAIEELYNQILKNVPNYTPWLLVSNGAMVQTNRIVEYYGLWRAFEKNGIVLPKGQRTQEYALRDAKEVQYFGAILLDNPEFLQIAKLTAPDSSAHLILTSNARSILGLLQKGWHYDSKKHPTDLLHHLSLTSNCLIHPIGEFDDIEGGAVAIASPQIISKCFRDTAHRSD